MMGSGPVPSTAPQDQFSSDVLPPYDAYMSDMGAEWKAKAAGSAAAYFAEHVWIYFRHHDPSQIHGTSSAEGYVIHLANSHGCPELKIIWDFALSTKHRFLERNPQGRSITTATGAFNTDPSGAGRLWLCDCSRYYDDVLQKVIDFWRKYLSTTPTYS
jgi:hypothetical protein